MILTIWHLSGTKEDLLKVCDYALSEGFDKAQQAKDQIIAGEKKELLISLWDDMKDKGIQKVLTWTHFNTNVSVVVKEVKI